MQFTGGQTIRSIVLNVEPLGSIRLPDTNLVDFRLAKRMSLGRGQTLEARFDFFNVFNLNFVTSRNLRAGSNSAPIGRHSAPHPSDRSDLCVLIRCFRAGVATWRCEQLKRSSYDREESNVVGLISGYVGLPGASATFTKQSLPAIRVQPIAEWPLHGPYGQVLGPVRR